jgi:hypothetical protein
LAKRGEGRFCDDVLTTKIPPNLPFPKGGISDIYGRYSIFALRVEGEDKGYDTIFRFRL